MRKTAAPLGQHFLKNPHYAAMLAEVAGITKDDTILEIGPGEGMLTRELLRRGKRVIAVEKDPTLVERLPSIFPEETASGALTIVSADARDFDPASHELQAGSYVLAANIPYYITGELLRKFLETPVQPRALAFLIQREVAQRIVDDKESILSLSVKAYGTPRVAAKVSAGNFNPPPKVDSAILVVEGISKSNFKDVSEQKFFEIVRAGFASKRKMLAGNLSAKFDKEKVLQVFARLQILPTVRAESVHLESWLTLAREL